MTLGYQLSKCFWKNAPFFASHFWLLPWCHHHLRIKLQHLMLRFFLQALKQNSSVNKADIDCVWVYDPNTQCCLWLGNLSSWRVPLRKVDKALLFGWTITTTGHSSFARSSISFDKVNFIHKNTESSCHSLSKCVKLANINSGFSSNKVVPHPS